MKTVARQAAFRLRNEFDEPHISGVFQALLGPTPVSRAIEVYERLAAYDGSIEEDPLIYCDDRHFHMAQPWVWMDPVTPASIPMLRMPDELETPAIRIRPCYYDEGGVVYNSGKTLLLCRNKRATLSIAWGFVQQPLSAIDNNQMQGGSLRAFEEVKSLQLMHLVSLWYSVWEKFAILKVVC
ncbi:MAG: hypothetical protein M1833_003179 [Piccolia ochrophora]|nr:MAG: hypothetical protein M1833_003179 [Piccolia ochrophora]